MEIARQDTFDALNARLVRYQDLKPCTTAFVDARTPGSDRKENFTIIGPGVAENPDQHVHIDIAHGFNVGAARQPPGCVNSQHSHETAEVFIVHSGRWRFMTGEHGTDGHVDLEPGDVISIPVGVFRGFENVGTEVGFMFAVLGGDDPGRVVWAPRVFELAREHGLVLLENGRLVDTSREAVPDGMEPMRPTSAADVELMSRMQSAEIAACVQRAWALWNPGGLSDAHGVLEYPVIGAANPAEDMAASSLHWAHGFQLRALRVADAARTPLHLRQEEEVLMQHAGRLTVSLPAGEWVLEPGDSFTIPVKMPRRFSNRGPEPSTTYVVRGGDQPSAAMPVSA